MVLKHHDAAQLLPIALGHKLGAAHGALSLIYVDVRVLKQSHAEDVEQQSVCRPLKAFAHPLFAVLLHAHAVRLKHRRFLVVASKLVHAGHESLIVALRFGHALHAPRLARVCAWVHLVVRDEPVGTHHAVVARLFAQLSCYDVAVKAVSHVLARLVVRYGVIGHYGRTCSRLAVELEGAVRERILVLLEASAGIDRKLSVAVVGVASSLSATAPGPVFRHGVDAVSAPCATVGRLKSVGIRPRHVCHEARLTSEGAAEPVPSRVGAEVGLWRQGCGDALQTILACRCASELLHEVRVKRGGEAQQSAPLRYLAPCSRRKLGIGGGRMSWVRRVVGRNAVCASFHKCLHVVAPSCRRRRALHLSHEHMSYVVAREKLFLQVAQVIGLLPALSKGLAVIGVVGHGQPVLRTVQHQSCNLLNGQSRGEVACAFLGCQSPVFVRHQLPRAKKILERQAVHLNDLYPRQR